MPSMHKEEHRKCIEERNGLREQLASGKLDEDKIGAVELRLQEVIQKRKELGKRLDEIREQRAVSFRNREIERRNAQFKILNEAQVVCSTLSGAAHDVLASMSMSFDTVVIDEAAQCIELSAIIPLRYGCQKCIMVGDPNQLPPTVLSQKAADYNYEQSLFVRMQNNYKDSVYLLDVQYRMHPAISKFPSTQFYNSRLLDGPEMDKLTAQPWHSFQEFGPYKFFNIRGTHQQNSRSKSYFNLTEVNCALTIVNKLLNSFPNVNFANKIGIISPYKEQIRRLRNSFSREFGSSLTTTIDFNTVDGFQGQEKDIIIFSCVRADEHQSRIGFLADIRRMNVALTRARSSLWILGSEPVLISDKTWRALIENAKDRQLVTDVNPSQFLRKLHRIDETGDSDDDESDYEPSSSISGKRSNEDGAKPFPKKLKSGVLPPAGPKREPKSKNKNFSSLSKPLAVNSKPVPKKSGKIPPPASLPGVPERKTSSGNSAQSSKSKGNRRDRQGNNNNNNSNNNNNNGDTNSISVPGSNNDSNENRGKPVPTANGILQPGRNFKGPRGGAAPTFQSITAQQGGVFKLNKNKPKFPSQSRGGFSDRGRGGRGGYGRGRGGRGGRGGPANGGFRVPRSDMPPP
ncbi:unnamed protein product [Ambrosiozyma monospora]|uniref:Unnamed protein product n=1 Tax=Ambrosiozyma monospora TaxID=43982 RepID=A0A9W7DJM9_AMBMO|nr:unnamed protein product [Ambrosiozyma monospora]